MTTSTSADAPNGASAAAQRNVLDVIRDHSLKATARGDQALAESLNVASLTLRQYITTLTRERRNASIQATQNLRYRRALELIASKVDLDLAAIRRVANEALVVQPEKE
jgi:hypothetical protein